MTHFTKQVAIVAFLVLLAGASDALAVCTNFGPGFPIFQCTSPAWFGDKPLGAGAVSVVWWQIGYGSAAVNDPVMVTPSANEGTGVILPGVFSGNDSGMFNMVLSNARAVLDLDPTVSDQTIAAIPPNALCSNYENSWSQPGVDGCADNPRTAADNDNKLNRYYSLTPVPEYYSTDYLVDYPMAVLLRESTGRFFAFAAVANKARGNDPASRSMSVVEGDFDLGTVIAEPNPAAGTDPRFNNMGQIPWQPVPRIKVLSAVINPDHTRTLTVNWPNVRQYSDQSRRPSSRAGLRAPGMGVLDMGSLVRYRLEQAQLISPTIDPNVLTWSPIDLNPADPNTVELVADPNALTISPPPIVMQRDSTLRIRTILGRRPANPTDQTLAICREGNCGDRCYEATDCMLAGCHNTITADSCPVSPPLLLLGGTLISERAIEVRAIKSKGQVDISFGTTSEQTVSSIDILGVGQRGDFVITSVAPLQGNTGVGASYWLQVSVGDMKGAKQIKVRLNGPNETSEPVPVE